MPRRKDSKHLPPKKRRQARGEDQGLGDAQATPAGEGVSPSSALPVFGCPPPTPPAAGTAQCSQIARATSSLAATISFACSGEGSTVRAEGIRWPSQPVGPVLISHTDHLTWSVRMLVRVLLEKYKMRMRITEAEMLNIINWNFRGHFAEILERATECMELVFGLDLMKIYPTSDSYILVGKLSLPKDWSLSSDSGFPKNGILMPILGLILLSDNCISEENMWQFLNMMGVYAGRIHFIFGEPRKFITRDLVQLRYLEYRRVPTSDPPRYEFLWGPRAHAETNKAEVIRFWAKVYYNILSEFQSLYHQSLSVEEGRAWPELQPGPAPGSCVAALPSPGDV